MMPLFCFCQKRNRSVRVMVLAASTLTLLSCSFPYRSNSQLMNGKNYIGQIAADDPSAVIVGQNVLAQGGNAVDAAVAMATTLAVTLPSRASLGAGGGCLVFDPSSDREPMAYLFLPQPGVNPAATLVSRPAAVPMMLRGLYRMHADYGHQDFAALLDPAQHLARHGSIVSSALASDLGVVGNMLLADRSSREIFSHVGASGGNRILRAGDMMVQPGLAAFIGRVQSAGVGDAYNGVLAQYFVEGSDQAGVGITRKALRQALTFRSQALFLPIHGSVRAFFLPPPADGGLGAAFALKAILAGQQDVDNIASGSVAEWRRQYPSSMGSGDIVALAQQFLQSATPSIKGNLPSLPASTTFAITDRRGEAIACSITMNNLFGTGRMAGNTGVMLAAAPGRYPVPLLVGSILRDRSKVMAVVTASGQNEASVSAARVLAAIIKKQPLPATGGEQGRINVITCETGHSKLCTSMTDENGLGLATR